MLLSGLTQVLIAKIHPFMAEPISAFNNTSNYDLQSSIIHLRIKFQESQLKILEKAAALDNTLLLATVNFEDVGNITITWNKNKEGINLLRQSLDSTKNQNLKENLKEFKTTSAEAQRTFETRILDNKIIKSCFGGHCLSMALPSHEAEQSHSNSLKLENKNIVISSISIRIIDHSILNSTSNYANCSLLLNRLELQNELNKESSCGGFTIHITQRFNDYEVAGAPFDPNHQKRILANEEYKFNTCPKGNFYKEYRKNPCVKCHYRCAVCYDSGPTNCVRCAEGYYYEESINSCLTDAQYYLNTFSKVIMRTLQLGVAVCGCLFVFLPKGVDIFWRLITVIQMLQALSLVHTSKTVYIKALFENMRITQVEFFPNIFKLIFFPFQEPYTVIDDYIVPTYPDESAPPNFLVHGVSSNFIITGGSQISLILFMTCIYACIKFLNNRGLNMKKIIEAFRFTIMIRLLDIFLFKIIVGCLLQISVSRFTNWINSVAILLSIFMFVVFLIFETWIMGLLINDDVILETDDFRTQYGVIYHNTARTNISSRYLVMFEQLRRFFIAIVVVTMRFSIIIQYSILISVHLFYLVDHAFYVRFTDKSFQRRYIVDDFLIFVATSLMLALHFVGSDSIWQDILTWSIIGMVCALLVDTIIFIIWSNFARVMILILKVTRFFTKLFPRLGSYKSDQSLQKSLDLYFKKSSESDDPSRVLQLDVKNMIDGEGSEKQIGSGPKLGGIETERFISRRLTKFFNANNEILDETMDDRGSKQDIEISKIDP